MFCQAAARLSPTFCEAETQDPNASPPPSPPKKQAKASSVKSVLASYNAPQTSSIKDVLAAYDSTTRAKKDSNTRGTNNSATRATKSDVNSWFGAKPSDGVSSADDLDPLDVSSDAPSSPVFGKRQQPVAESSNKKIAGTNKFIPLLKIDNWYKCGIPMNPMLLIWSLLGNQAADC